MYPHLHIHTFSAHINTRTQAKVTETYIHTHILTHSHTHKLTYSGPSNPKKLRKISCKLLRGLAPCSVCMCVFVLFCMITSRVNISAVI